MKAHITMMKCCTLPGMFGLVVLINNSMQEGVMGLQTQSPFGHFSPIELQEPWRVRGIAHSQPLLSNLQHYRHSTNKQSRSNTALLLFRKIAENLQSIEEEYNREVEQASLSPLDVFKAEGKKSADIPKAYALMKERMAATAGDTETKLQLLEPRNYANGELLNADHVDVPPNLSDLNQPPSAKKMDRLWISPPFRMSVVVGAYLIFPFLQKLCNGIITVETNAEDFNMVTSQFAPGIGVLYGTIVALTLDILYERESRIQENITLEAGLLSQIAQHLLSLFDSTKEKDLARETSQLVAEQVRMLGTRTRGAELLSIMRADPYAQILGIVDEYHLEKGYEFTPQQNSLTECLRSEIPQIMEARAKRLSDEASSLPPTHFLVLTILTALILIGYTVATLTLVDENGAPSQESQVVFAGLSAVYVLFYNFCKDLNSPFDGVYQIKRSAAASYLLQVKWLISNQEFGRDIVFDDVHPVFKEEGSKMSQKDVSVFGEAVVPRVDDDEKEMKERERKKQKKLSASSSSAADFSSTRKRRRRGREMRARLERGARNLATDILRSVQFVDESPTATSAAGERYRQKRKEVLRRRRQTNKVADEVEERVRLARLEAKQRREKLQKEKKERDERLAKKLIERGEKPLTASFVKSVAWAEDGTYTTPSPQQRKVVKKVAMEGGAGAGGTAVPTKKKSQNAGGMKSAFQVAWDDPTPAQRRKMAKMAALQKENSALDSDVIETKAPALQQQQQEEVATMKEPTVLVPHDDDKWSDISVCTTSLSTAETILRSTTTATTTSSQKASPAADYFRSKGGGTTPAQPAEIFQVALASLDTMNVGLVEANNGKINELKKEKEECEAEASDAVAYFRYVGGGDTSPSKTTVNVSTKNTFAPASKANEPPKTVRVTDELKRTSKKIKENDGDNSTIESSAEEGEDSLALMPSDIESTESMAIKNVPVNGYSTEKEVLHETTELVEEEKEEEEEAITTSPTEQVVSSSPSIDVDDDLKKISDSDVHEENTSSAIVNEYTDVLEARFDVQPNGSGSNDSDTLSSSSLISNRVNGQEERSAVLKYFQSVAGSNGVSQPTTMKDKEDSTSTTTNKTDILPDKINGEKDIELLALKYFRTVSGKEMAPVRVTKTKQSTPAFASSPSSWDNKSVHSNGVKADDTITVTNSSPASSKTKTTTTVTSNKKQQLREQRVLTRRNAVASEKDDIIDYFRQSGGFGFGGKK